MDSTTALFSPMAMPCKCFSVIAGGLTSAGKMPASGVHPVMRNPSMASSTIFPICITEILGIDNDPERAENETVAVCDVCDPDQLQALLCD